MAESQLRPMEMTEDDFRRFASLIQASCGVAMGSMKFELLRTRVSKRVRALKMGSFRQYYEWVCGDSSGTEMEKLIDVVTTHKTEFFRESAHYALLERHLARGVARSQPLRLWSAACSSGEEPYSLAMAMLESPEKPRPFKILATDISTAVLGSAMEGQYPPQRLEGLPKGAREKYFEPLRKEGQLLYRVLPSLRQTIQFSRFNLTDGTSFVFSHKFDAIFCRNVMIYFDRPTQETLVQRLSAQLREGGMLFTGFSESLIGIRHDLQAVSPSAYLKPKSWDLSR